MGWLPDCPWRPRRGDSRPQGESGGEIMAHGDATFVQALSRLGLIDEYRLVILPVALGNELPLFKDLAKPLRMDLSEAKSLPDGTVIHRLPADQNHGITPGPICDAVFIDAACFPIRAWPPVTAPTRPNSGRSGPGWYQTPPAAIDVFALASVWAIRRDHLQRSQQVKQHGWRRPRIMLVRYARVHNNGRARICRRDRQ